MSVATRRSAPPPGDSRLKQNESIVSDRVRRFIAGLSLASFAVVLVGLPMPGALNKREAQSFPCELHGCGCVDAEHCWQECCCYTDAEKFAWAERHGVTVPLMAAAQLSAPLAESESDCCHDSNGGPERACATAETAPVGQPAAWTLVLTPRVLECRGGALIWLSIGPSLPPPPVVIASGETRVIAWLACGDSKAPLPVLLTDTPPPRAI